MRKKERKNKKRDKRRNGSWLERSPQIKKKRKEGKQGKDKDGKRE